MIDPRPLVFSRRLEPVKRIVAVGGGKGGVGKTTVTVLLALQAARSGARVGLLDLDLHGAAAHLLLGVTPSFPDEEGGILPLEGPHGLAFMSAANFSADRPLALRGHEVSDAIAELLAVTIWPELDLLLVDLPPGLGESLLDLVRYMPSARILAVTTPSAPAVSVADRFLSAVDGRAPLVGLVANMAGSPEAAETDAARADAANAGTVKPGDRVDSLLVVLAEKHGIELLARVPPDEKLEDAAGMPEALLQTAAADSLSSLSWQLTGV